jgi:hypothetical protein
MCCLVAAVTVAIDAYFSAQEGYLSRPTDYDGISYMLTARAPYLMLRALHVRTGLHELLSSISPLWISILTAQQLILGEGTWQAFSVRFWAVALLLILVYWVMSLRATRAVAIAAVILTALLPLVSAGVRASSWEYFSGQAIYFEHWYLDDLRPDFLAIVLILWSAAALAEHSEAPRRSAYVVSAAFAAAAVLAKSSTAPVALVAWAAVLCINWFWNRRSPEATRMTLLAAILLTVLLIPWAVFGHGALTVVTYLKLITAYQGAYATSGGLIGGFTYFPVLIPTQLGQIEAWPVIAGALLLTVALLRRQLGPAELIYAVLAPLFYMVFSLPPSKNTQLGMWISLSIWIFFLAGLARLAGAKWPVPVKRAAPVGLSAVAIYTLVVYGLGAFALANWPVNEHRSNAQLVEVNTEVAQELSRRMSSGQCFAYAPGPGWPSTLIYAVEGATGNAPASTSIDVDPTSTTTSDYVASASKCMAVLAYREDIATVAQVFFAPPVRQPYLRAVAQWVQSPDSGYTLDRSWTFSDLAPGVPHRLGHFEGVSLTVDLYLRNSAH